MGTHARASMSLTLPFLSFSGIKLVPVSAGNSRAKTAAPAASRYTIRASNGSDEPFEISLKVEGMMCDGCASSITEALEGAADAVKDVTVDLEAVQEAGFEAEPDF